MTHPEFVENLSSGEKKPRLERTAHREEKEFQWSSFVHTNLEGIVDFLFLLRYTSFVCTKLRERNSWMLGRS